MKVQSEINFLRHGVAAALVAAGMIAAASVHAEPVNESGVTSKTLFESLPLCGRDIRDRVTMIQFENGATYVLAEKSEPVLRRAGTADSWEVDHQNSGN